MDSVKPQTSGTADRRSRRDREATRVRMVEAARQLFLERGYAATTIPAIATRAGVAVPTIYWAFGSKRAIVAEIRGEWLAAAQTSVRLEEVLRIDDPGARFDAYAAFMTNQWATGAEALAIQQDARRADPEVASEIEEVLAERAERLAAVIAPLGPVLREGLALETARDILLAISLVEVYRELAGRGWTNEQYRDWLARSLREQLLGT